MPVAVTSHVLPRSPERGVTVVITRIARWARLLLRALDPVSSLRGREGELWL